jgi:hypothetical protein
MFRATRSLGASVIHRARLPQSLDLMGFPGNVPSLVGFCSLWMEQALMMANSDPIHGTHPYAWHNYALGAARTVLNPAPFSLRMAREKEVSP